MAFIGFIVRMRYTSIKLQVKKYLVHVHLAELKKRCHFLLKLSLPHVLMTYNLKRLREKPNKITTFFERKKAKTVFSLQEFFFYKSRPKKNRKGLSFGIK